MNYIFKRILLVGIAGLMGFSFIGCGGAAVSPKHAKQVEKKAQMFTQNTMWAQGSSISVLNYSLGFPIPVNSIVFYEDINSKQILFMYNEKRYYLRNSPKHSKMNMDQMLDSYFGHKKVKLSKFTKKEQEAIKAGRVEVGMSKKAVLVSRGYPPAYATPSTKGDSWQYWKFKKHFVTDTVMVHFKDGKVSSIED